MNVFYLSADLSWVGGCSNDLLIKDVFAVYVIWATYTVMSLHLGVVKSGVIRQAGAGENGETSHKALAEGSS